MLVDRTFLENGRWLSSATAQDTYWQPYATSDGNKRNRLSLLLTNRCKLDIDVWISIATVRQRGISRSCNTFLHPALSPPCSFSVTRLREQNLSVFHSLSMGFIFTFDLKKRSSCWLCVLFAIMERIFHDFTRQELYIDVQTNINVTVCKMSRQFFC